MDLAREGRDEFGASRIVAAERRKLNWGAIVAGTLATIGLQMLMMWFAGAIGLSAFDPYQMSQSEGSSYTLPVLFLLITALGSSFFGAWVAGHWANLHEAEDAVIHGALTWALASLFLALGIGSLFQMGATAAQATAQGAQAAAQMGADTAQNRGAAQTYGKALSFSSLDDQRFTSFLTQRAKTFAAANPSKDGQAVNVSADQAATPDMKDRSIKPEDVADNDALITFVAVNANMSENQAEEFLKKEQNAIAQAQNQAQKRWHESHKKELAEAEKVRKAASRLAWTMTGLSLLALGASIGGAYMGWKQRYYDEDDLQDEDRRRGVPINPSGSV